MKYRDFMLHVAPVVCPDLDRTPPPPSLPLHPPPCLPADAPTSLWPHQIVKFCRALQERVSPLSDVDLGVLQLQRSERLLEERLQTLGEKAEGYEPIRDGLKKGFSFFF